MYRAVQPVEIETLIERVWSERGLRAQRARSAGTRDGGDLHHLGGRAVHQEPIGRHAPLLVIVLCRLQEIPGDAPLQIAGQEPAGPAMADVDEVRREQRLELLVGVVGVRPRHLVDGALDGKRELSVRRADDLIGRRDRPLLRLSRGRPLDRQPASVQGQRAGITADLVGHDVDVPSVLVVPRAEFPQLRPAAVRGHRERLRGSTELPERHDRSASALAS